MEENDYPLLNTNAVGTPPEVGSTVVIFQNCFEIWAVPPSGIYSGRTRKIAWKHTIDDEVYVGLDFPLNFWGHPNARRIREISVFKINRPKNEKTT